MVSGGDLAFGSYTEIDELFREKAKESALAKGEALLHAIHRIVYERVRDAAEREGRDDFMSTKPRPLHRVELQIDNFATAKEGQDWMLSVGVARVLQAELPVDQVRGRRR